MTAVPRSVRRYSAAPLASLALVLAMSAPTVAAPAADPGRGAAAFQQCAACHAVTPGRHLTGPSLAGVWGRKAGSAEGFGRYSDALKKSGIVWNERTLDRWLENPQGVVPGTSMTFPGIANVRQRADVIAYLEAASQGEIPAVPLRGGRMMGGDERPNLKEAGKDRQVTAVRFAAPEEISTTIQRQCRGDAQ